MKMLLLALSLLAAGAAEAQIQTAFFGMHTNNRGHMPSVPYYSLRLWDIGALDWADADPACDGVAANYRFANLDATLDSLVAGGVRSVYYTFGHTPACAATAANLPPHDLNADGSGTNQHFRDFVGALSRHVHARYPGLITHWETWNEANQNVTWRGTVAQLVRMFEDINEIVKAIEPGARVGTPSCVQPSTFTNLSACNSFFTRYFSAPSTRGGPGPKAADFVAWHPYVHLNVAGNVPRAEDVPVALAGVHSALRAAGIAAKPVVASEGGWGNVAVNGFTDPDLHTAFLGKMYLLLAAGGLQRFYWYQWDNVNRGTLWQPTANCNGVMAGVPDPAGGYRCPAALAYEQVRSWILNWTPLRPCSLSGTVYTCEFSGSAGMIAQAVWDTAQSCSLGSCTTISWSPPGAGYQLWRDLEGHAGAITGNTVAIGAKPTWLEGRPQAPVGTQFSGGITLMGTVSAQ